MQTMYFDIETWPLREDAPLEATLSPASAAVSQVTVFDRNRNAGVIYGQHTLSDAVLPSGWRYKCRDERTMLAEFWKGASQYDLLYGFSIRQFDIPFLTHRSLVHDLRPAPWFRVPMRIERQTNPKILDLQYEFSFSAQREHLSIRALAQMYGCRELCDLLAPDALYDAQRELDVAKILRHCVSKVRVTENLFSIWQKHVASHSFLNTFEV